MGDKLNMILIVLKEFRSDFNKFKKENQEHLIRIEKMLEKEGTY